MYGFDEIPIFSYFFAFCNSLSPFYRKKCVMFIYYNMVIFILFWKFEKCFIKFNPFEMHSHICSISSFTFLVDQICPIYMEWPIWTLSNIKKKRFCNPLQKQMIVVRGVEIRSGVIRLRLPSDHMVNDTIYIREKTQQRLKGIGQ